MKKPPNHLKKPKVLVIEDDALLCSSLRSLLRKDYDADFAQTGEDALEKMDVTEYDAIFCDLILPNINGKQVYDSIVKKTPHMARRVVFTSGGPGDGLKFLQGLKYVAKPYSGPDVIRALTSVIFSN